MRAFWWMSFLGMVFLSGCATATLEPREPSLEENPLTVMTYNVNYGLAGDPAGIEAIREEGADLVLLQETTPRWEIALHDELAELYPYRAFVHSRGAGGMGVLSRYPFSNEVLEASEGWFPAWRLEVETPEGPLQVLQVHLHPPISDEGSVVSGYFTTGGTREAEIRAFFKSVQEDMPTMVVGDFNEDYHGDAVGFLKDRGYQSALELFHPDANTWRWPTPVMELTSTLDHLMFNKVLEPLSARVLYKGRSDHFPVVGTFVLRGNTQN